MTSNLLALDESPRTSMLGEILELSETMLEAAQEGAWDALASQEQRRQPLVWDFFATPLSAQENRVYRRSLERIREISEELTRLAGEQRELLGALVRRAPQQRHAIKTYQMQQRAGTQS